MRYAIGQARRCAPLDRFPAPPAARQAVERRIQGQWRSEPRRARAIPGAACWQLSSAVVAATSHRSEEVKSAVLAASSSAVVDLRSTIVAAPIIGPRREIGGSGVTISHRRAVRPVKITAHRSHAMSAERITDRYNRASFRTACKRSCTSVPPSAPRIDRTRRSMQRSSRATIPYFVCPWAAASHRSPLEVNGAAAEAASVPLRGGSY
jgi:hypothetical protein